MTEKLLFPFLVSFLLSIIFTSVAIFLGKKIDWKKREAPRHIHEKSTLRLGGVAMVATFVLVIWGDKNLVITPELFGFLAGSVLLLIIGIWDDIREIFWKFQLFTQIMVSLLVFILGVRIYFITNPLSGGIINLDTQWGVLVSSVLVILWVTLIMNAINWADGIDGLSGGITLIASFSIFILSLKPEVNQPPVAIISIILFGTILGFLVFNFHPARVLAGTAGSMFMGFSLAVLAIFSGTKIATAVVVLALPILDFFWVIFERIKSKKSVFNPDKNHLHHKFLKLGWSQRKISSVFLGFTALISFIALNTRIIGKSITLLSTVIIMLISFLIVQKKIKIKNEK